MVGQLNSKDMKRVKTNINSTKEKAIRNAILKELANVHYINKVAVDIYGKIHYLTEAQVRALQVVAAKLANTDKEAFEDFRENVVVYSGRDITHSKYVVRWRDNGFFIDNFQKGFYDADYYLFGLLSEAQKK